MNELTPEERGAQIQKKARKTVLKAMSDAGLVNLVLAEIRDAVEAEREACAKAARLVAEEYDVARQRFSHRPALARKYDNMRFGALAAESAIRARGKAHGP